MARRTVFCVQSFKRAGRQLLPERAAQFGSATEAVELGERLRPRSAGVIVYALRGDPEAEAWEEPEVFMAHGLVPQPGS